MVSPQPVGRERTARAVPKAEGVDGGDVLNVLADATCRAILATIDDGSRSATEVATACDLPLSTTYRKLNRLEAVGLLEERTRIDPDRTHRSEYRAVAERVAVTLGADGQMRVIVAFHDDRAPLVCPLPN